MLNELTKYISKPELDAQSTDVLWDNPYISEIMLSAHLEPDSDTSSRKHEFIDRSVAWITEIAPPAEYPRLLDLGCGPGLYTQRFHNAGYNVTGLDYSKRSIRYAGVEAALSKSKIEYLYENYLTIDYSEQFDVITLIYCDYAALSTKDRILLLKKIYRALKPDGKFIFDVFTHKMRLPESRTWQFYDDGGFYCDKPHICINSVYQYIDNRAELRQSIIITDESVECYNVWDHFFNKNELVAEVFPAGFCKYKLYGDVAGAEYSDSSDTICGVFTK
jgi:SAM-dependent methyltransferase